MKGVFKVCFNLKRLLISTKEYFQRLKLKSWKKRWILKQSLEKIFVEKILEKTFSVGECALVGQ